MDKTPILELRNVVSAYGRIKALKGISLKIYAGEIVAIIGANGAGKSTTLMVTCGVVPVDAGDIRYQGRSIRGIAAEKLPPLGLCQVPEGRRIFPRLTVKENLLLGAFYRRDRAAIGQLQHDGWRILTIWECALKGKTRLVEDEVIGRAANWLEGNRKLAEITGKPIRVRRKK